jgi:hypothetical protein
MSSELLEEIRKLGEERDAAHERRMEEHRQWHKTRMEKAAALADLQREVVLLQRQVAEKQRKEAEAAKTKQQSQNVADQMDAIQCMILAATPTAKKLIRGADGRVESIEEVYGHARDCDEVAKAVLSDLEKSRNA